MLLIMLTSIANMNNNNMSTDYEKLQSALKEITTRFGSFHDILNAFGLADLPTTQRYGILFGIIVFTLTVATVIALLIFGGTFRRIREQSNGKTTSVESDYQIRLDRPLLLERLLEARHRMIKENYPQESETKSLLTTNLTRMLCNDSPPKEDAVDDSKESFDFTKSQRAEVMKGYKQNYYMGYRKCQDKPGGPVLTGRPEARYEAYARAYASCGDYTQLWYRRSYARLYESICCESLEADDKFSTLYRERAQDIIGKFVRLEALDVIRHLQPLYNITCTGNPIYLKPAYDPQQVYGFQRDGPFNNLKQLQESFIFQPPSENQASFAIIQNFNDRFVGIIILDKDQPQHLSIQINPPIVNPSNQNSKEQLESCFLLMDRLFAFGYRRIQISIDSKDTESAKLADRLGFTYEGCILKDKIIKESNRDSNVYAMLNSDWDLGARKFIYRKLYGTTMMKADMTYNQKQDELDEQQRVLAEQKQEEEKDKNA